MNIKESASRCRHGGGGCQKSGKIVDVVYGWSQGSKKVSLVFWRNFAIPAIVYSGYYLTASANEITIQIKFLPCPILKTDRKCLQIQNYSQ